MKYKLLLKQIVAYPTRVTENTQRLIDQIHTADLKTIACDVLKMAYVIIISILRHLITIHQRHSIQQINTK